MASVLILDNDPRDCDSCPECGEPVTMTANYCHSCGQRLPKHNWRL